jgi:periplasmic protein TonB
MQKIYFTVIILFFLTVSVEAQNNLSIIDTIDSPFTKVEIEAEFPGGAKEWRKYLSANLDMRLMDRNKVPNGTYVVIIRFIVAKDGAISSIVAETKHGYGLEEEAIRMIKISPKWTPAKQNGYIVSAYRRQPITFIMSED